MMTELKSNPMVVKLLEHAEKSKTISFDEISDCLPEEIVKSETVNDVIALLEEAGVKFSDDSGKEINQEEAHEVDGILEDDEHSDIKAVIETDVADEDDADEVEAIASEEVVPQRKLVFNDKDTVIDDPIRLYLREIGKDKLLTAEQEVELSKQMEDGESIIKKGLRTSGMIIPEFHELAQKGFSKTDPREMNLSKKELSDFLAERRRISHFYKESFRDLIALLKQYMDIKNRIAATDGDVSSRQETRGKAGSTPGDHQRD